MLKNQPNWIFWRRGSEIREKKVASRKTGNKLGFQI